MFQLLFQFSDCGRVGMIAQVQLIGMDSKHLMCAAFWEYSGEHDTFYFIDRILFPFIIIHPSPSAPTLLLSHEAAHTHNKHINMGSIRGG